MPSEAVFPSIQITIYKSWIERLQDGAHLAQLREQAYSLIHIGRSDGCGDVISESFVLGVFLVTLFDESPNEFILQLYDGALFFYFLGQFGQLHIFIQLLYFILGVGVGEGEGA